MLIFSCSVYNVKELVAVIVARIVMDDDVFGEQLAWTTCALVLLDNLTKPAGD
jgi:hypothetical protein